MDVDVDPALASMTPPATITTAAGPSTAPAADNDGDDPVVATYNVFIKPPLSANRRLLVLQHPNKHDARRPARPPTEVRLKPRTGMVEVDMPLDHSAHYDRGKGVAWGSQLQKSTAAKSGGSHGLAGGFGVHAPAVRSGGGARRGGAGGAHGEDGDGGDAPGLDWVEALRTDQVLRTQTLGGLWPEENDCRYMVGVFQGENLHLTPVASLVHLRPQLHHIDAAAEQERLTRPRDTGAGGGGSAAAAAAGGKEGSSARAIHMTIKAAGDGSEAVVMETMADRLRAVQTEPWQRMAYVDDEKDDAWAVYHETLFLEPEVGAGDAPAAGEGEDEAAPGGDPELADKVNQLEARWGEDDLLRAVSGVEREEAPESAAAPAAAPVKVEAGAPEKTAAKGKGKEKAEPKKPVRTKASSAAPKKPTTRGKAAAAKAAASANVMEID
ncbi:DNA-directed RNA polymerase III subunit rpc5 [Pleurostoma richardsiae]|uniref:DNA-directed RNA polymerase III subunit rpc5 n=1 Tax=Pleurostoma richardsiae TaxID=41990 RepID=A0AA38R8K7_9PEZI|nr:DNA-directed RNA polymerase III subunit rpc5 [Pleurostoma richardsiae]